MPMLRRILQGSLLTALCAAPSVWAQEGGYECTQGGLVRQVKIVFDTPGEPVPCRVVYSKPTEQIADQILWSASSEAGYCAYKANEFRGQLEGWGWNCGAREKTAAAPPDEPTAEGETELVSDESALAPADPAAEQQEVVEAE